MFLWPNKVSGRMFEECIHVKTEKYFLPTHWTFSIYSAQLVDIGWVTGSAGSSLVAHTTDTLRVNGLIHSKEMRSQEEKSISQHLASSERPYAPAFTFSPWNRYQQS